VLVLADEEKDAEFIADALDPAALPPGVPRTCHVDPLLTRQLTDRVRDSLKDYTCIFLNNVAHLNDADWARLNAYVRDGGGLVIGLGNACDVPNYNAPTATPLVPATLDKKTNPVPKTTFGKVHDYTHPLFNRYAKELEPVLSQVPVWHYWAVAPAEGSRTLLSYADNAPALIERTLKGAKTGRILLWTTPLARRAKREDPNAWNEFPEPQFWPFVAILLQTVPYMAGTTGERLNYEAGQDAILPIDPTRRFKNYVVEGVDAKTSDRHSPPATSDALVVVSPAIGRWRVTASGSNGEKAAMGFSVNPPVSEMQLTRLESAELEQLFGKDGYALADDLDSLTRATIRSRVGFELFPWLMALILLLVTAENFLANKFYREAGQRAAA
jgi:hypothetical protein